MNGRLNNIFKFGRLKAHGSRGRVQIEETNGEIHSDIEHTQEFGFESKAPLESETYAAYRGGNQDSGAVLVIAGQAPIVVGDGDVCIYNSAGATIEVSGGTITITGDCVCTGDVSDAGTATPSMEDIRTLFNTHTHPTAPVGAISPPTQQM